VNILSRCLGLTLILFGFGSNVMTAADTPAANRADNVSPPEGFVSLFNGKDFAGWKESGGKPTEFLEMPASWKIDDNTIMFIKESTGKDGHLWTEKSFKNWELHVDWKFAGGTTGFFTSPAHIKIWDVNKTTGWAATGSGSLGYGDTMVKPIKKADKPLGQWNHFRILVESPPARKDPNGKPVASKGTISIWLNDELVIDKEPRTIRKSRIGLQDHGSQVGFKNLYIRELPE